MKIELYNENFLNNTLKDNIASVIIADPPYYRVKGDFDYIYKNFEEYLSYVRKWAIECKRLLKPNGTLFWYGHSKNIAYSQIILDKYFYLESNIAIEMTRGLIRKNYKTMNKFAPCSERVLMYSNNFDIKPNKATNIHKKHFQSVIDMIQETTSHDDFYRAILETNITKNKNSAKSLASYKSGTHKTRFDFLNEKLYNHINNFNYSYNELKYVYDKIKEEKLRYFNNVNKLTDVFRFKENTHELSSTSHPTQKPIELTNIWLESCSRENDLIIIPFAGSGTEMLCCKQLNRNVIGYEIDKEYIEIIETRLNIESQ